MSGQYKIRRDGKDDFSDIKTGYKLAKAGPGGCWQGIKSCFGIILLLFICLAVLSLTSGTSSAQSNSCFPHKTLYTTKPVTIRKSDSRFSASTRETTVRKTYNVYESKKDSLFNSCWIRINGGWILRRPTGSAIKPGTVNTSNTSNTRITTAKTSSSRCYTASRAYITGNMNIRSGPSTGHSKTGMVTAGKSYTVIQSERGDDYCWLKISEGWIAKTGRVQSNKPSQTDSTRTSTQIRRTTYSSTDRTGLPRIEGDAKFQSDITKAFNYLRNNARNWFNYVKARVSVVSSGWVQGGKVKVRERRVIVNPNAYPKTMELASVLVHEACHIMQYERGNYHGVSVVTLEEECYKVQLDMVGQVAPGGVWYNRIKNAIPQIPILYAGR